MLSGHHLIGLQEESESSLAPNRRVPITLAITISVVLLVIGALSGFVGWVLIEFACWDAPGPPGCRDRGLSLGMAFVALAAISGLAGIASAFRAFLRRSAS